MPTVHAARFVKYVELNSATNLKKQTSLSLELTQTFICFIVNNTYLFKVW